MAKVRAGFATAKFIYSRLTLRFLKARKQKANKKRKSAMLDQGHKEFITGKKFKEKSVYLAVFT